MVFLCLGLIQVFCNALKMGQRHLQTKVVRVPLRGVLEKVLHRGRRAREESQGGEVCREAMASAV